MKFALDEASMSLSDGKRTTAMKVTLASGILKAAAKGERDPIKLKNAAMLESPDE